MEGTSVDDDDDADSNEADVVKLANRALIFKKAEEVIMKVVQSIDEDVALTTSVAEVDRSSAKCESAREELINESRHFVTASKLFVKSATESEDRMMECLGHCAQAIDRIGRVARLLAANAPLAEAPATRALLAKVKDVALAYAATVKAAGEIKRTKTNDSDPAMATLMKRATALASVLTTLMRSLRVFN